MALYVRNCDGSCGCVCCSTNYLYWGLTNYNECLLNDVKQLDASKETLESVCPTEESIPGDPCSAPLVRRGTSLPVNKTECDSSNATGKPTLNVCYYCNFCYATCGAEVPSLECAPEGWCDPGETGDIMCTKYVPVGYVASGCYGAPCNCADVPPVEINGLPNPAYLQWQLDCYPADRGECSGGYACIRATKPSGTGGGPCGKFDPQPFATDCSYACPEEGTACGSPPYVERCFIYYGGSWGPLESQQAGTDECGNTYYACGNVCTEEYTMVGGCEYNPSDALFSCCGCDCTGADAGSLCCVGAGEGTD